ncbi:MAG: nucleoside deaminase [Proteobacteria bacterium]|nr:nucleoside deaminase [Pseudomonadota bacterium]
MKNKFMREAIALSINNVTNNLGGPFGAVVVKNDEIIATGTNCVTKDNDPTAHAEMVAIRNACKSLNSHQLDDCEIYTSCEPCPMCLAAIYWARPKAVYYGNSKQDAAHIEFDDQFIYDELALSLDQRKLKIKQMLHSEAIKAFELWQKNSHKIKY